VIKLAVGWLTLFVMGTDLFVISPLLPDLAADFGVSAAGAGLSVTVFSITYMAGAPVFGRVADRHGRRRILTWSLVAFAAANVLTAIAPTFAGLLAARVFAGLTAAGISPSVYALVGEAAPPARRATWMGIAVSGLLLSLSIGTPIGALAAATFGWPTVFLALAAASLLLTFANGLAWPREGAVTSALPAASSGWRTAAQRLLLTVVWATGLYAVYTYLGSGLAEAGYSTAAIARVLVVYGCGALAGTLLGGRLADRRGPRFTIALCLSGLAVLFLAVRITLAAGLPIDIPLGLASAAAQLFFPAQQSGLAHDFPSQRATVLAWNNSALFLGVFLGSLVGGESMTRGGLGQTLLVGAVTAAVAVLINWRVSPGRANLPGAPQAETTGR